MNQYLTWLKNNPTGVTTLSTALLSAAVAVMVLVVSQWALSRRNRKEFLTNKLEELYLLINQVGEHNVERFELLVKLASGECNFENTTRAEAMKTYGLDIHKKIVMLIRLYFPKLSKSHQELFIANQKINTIIYKLAKGGETNDSECNNAMSKFAARLNSFEEEIIQNMNILLESHVLPQKYNRHT